MGIGVATIIGAVVSAAGSLFSGMQQRKAADRNAAIAAEAAVAAKDKAAYDEGMHRERVARLISSQRALYGKAGVTLEGTPLLVMEDTAAQGELDALAIRHGGDVEAARQRSQASLYKMQGKSAMTAGLLGAGSSLLTGYSRYKKAEF